MIKKLKSFAKKHYHNLFPIAAGGLLVFSFAPYNVATAAFFSIAVLLYALKGLKPKKAAFYGLLYGFGLFGLGASWIYVSIYDHAGESVAVSGVITFGFVLILSLFPALLCYLLNRFWPNCNAKRNLFAFPAMWVLFEGLRGWVFTGFPWLFLGYSQMHTQLVGLATVGGVWLVSWATAFNGAILYEVFKFASTPKGNRKWLYYLLGGTLVLWVGSGFIKSQSTVVADQEFSVAMVQGNIPQALRWDNSQIQNIAATYSEMTAANLDVDLIIWPESAIPVPLPASKVFFDDIHAAARANNTGFITGVPVKAEQKEKYYNGMIALGLGQGIYYKKHLVPFGEYVPLEGLLRGLIQFFDLPMSQFIKGPKQAPMQVGGLIVGPAICYEIAYPLTIRQAAKQAHFIVTLSNDAWFGKSIGPKQHLQIAQMRALETGRYVLRATNSGLTAIINHKGKITEKIPAFEAEVLRGTASTVRGNTLWVIAGPWLLLVWLGLMLTVALWPDKKKK